MRIKVCRKSGCTTKIPYDQSNPFCDEHRNLYHPSTWKQTERRQSYSKYNRFKRDKEANQFYHTKQWSGISKSLKTQACNTCTICGHTYDKPGYLVTDHIIPRRVDKRRQLDLNNLWVICKRCHYWKGELESQVYNSDSLVANIDASHQWNRQKVAHWILEKEEQSQNKK
ncbi:HNH endonuclease signature motif containing protein [Lactiplantibacillus paraxiangfangensis]|uniref:HNH endonuclease n=1 Tax=Lactiplantibacillus paraxiangfangensis TaxID=3076224 RepID=UPI0030C70A96